MRQDWAAAHTDYKTALSHKHAERYDEAVSLLIRAVERYPGHVMAHELMAYCHERTRS